MNCGKAEGDKVRVQVMEQGRERRKTGVQEVSREGGKSASFTKTITRATRAHFAFPHTTLSRSYRRWDWSRVSWCSHRLNPSLAQLCTKPFTVRTSNIQDYNFIWEMKPGYLFHHQSKQPCITSSRSLEFTRIQRSAPPPVPPLPLLPFSSIS